MIARRHQGFTAVEVLITLFIATILIGGGYQIYGIVTAHTKEARERTVASNYAYEALRRQAVQPSSRCSATAEQNISSELPNPTSLPGPATMTRDVTCPYGNNDAISRITIRLTYGAPQREVVHALYVRAES